MQKHFKACTRVCNVLQQYIKSLYSVCECNYTPGRDNNMPQRANSMPHLHSWHSVVHTCQSLLYMLSCCGDYYSAEWLDHPVFVFFFVIRSSVFTLTGWKTAAHVREDVYGVKEFLYQTRKWLQEAGKKEEMFFNNEDLVKRYRSHREPMVFMAHVNLGRVVISFYFPLSETVTVFHSLD